MASGCCRLEWVTLEPDTGQLEVVFCWVAQLRTHAQQKPSLQLTFIVSL